MLTNVYRIPTVRKLIKVHFPHASKHSTWVVNGVDLYTQPFFHLELSVLHKENYRGNRFTRFRN